LISVLLNWRLGLEVKSFPPFTYVVGLPPLDVGTARKTLTASKELVLSAGVINSPQILMLSGIGDREHLSALGIKTILDLPAVGKDMPDHAINVVLWAANDTAPPPWVFRYKPWVEA
jgi:choline dehydrogenase-like flavoprotein